MRLSRLADILGLEFVGDGERDVVAPATLKSATERDVSFYHNPKYRKQLVSTRAGAVIMREKDLFDGAKFTALLSSNPLDDFRRCIDILVPFRKPEPKISELAAIDEGARIGEDVTIGPFAVIGKARVGDGTTIGAGCVIGDGVVIGRDCHIYPRVVIYDGVVIGDRVIVHAGAVLGADGFGYSRDDDGKFHKIRQLGGLTICDDVEIGANATIDRGSLDDTVIGRGTKIDNLVQIGHNVIVGEDCALAGQVGIAGSCSLGNGVLLGGQVGLAGHLSLGDNVVVCAQSGVDKSFGNGITLLGSPARPIRKALKQQAALSKLVEILKRIKIDEGE